MHAAIIKEIISHYENGYNDETLEKLLDSHIRGIAFQLPADVVQDLLRFGPAVWGATPGKTDEQHADQLRTTIQLTREHFGIEAETTEMHGVYLADDLVLCHVGISPNSPIIARILTAAWNQLVEIAKAQHG